jgi:anthranilate/para-aminobenzoate synthase component I
MVFLDSATADLPDFGGNDSGLEEPRYSLLAARPVEILRGHIGDLSPLRGALRRHQPWSGDAPLPDLGFPSGGAIGSIDYDGSYCFGIYPHALIYDHRCAKWFDCGGLSDLLLEPSALPPLMDRPSAEFQARMSRDDFCRMVERAQEYIGAGDIYQVNLSHRFCAPWEGDSDAAFAWYGALRDASPATHAAYLDLGGRQVMSSSPELFLELSGSLARTRPIKGTRPRFRDPDLDERSAYDLITSPKEVAELIMITDLERNDLGQICEFGTVRAAELLKLERHQHIFHLVSTVEGQLRGDVDHLDAVAACFPGGSITGAPKKRAREIIAELEPEPRGMYTGAIGVIGFEAEAETRLSIAIRTAVAEKGKLHFHVGAGIVADSDPQLEYEETLHKARGLFAANGG